MLMATILTILFVMLVALIRAFKGPSINDRILAVSLFGTKTVLFLASLGYLTGRSYFLDIAIVYALLNFVSVIGILRFFEQQELKRRNKEGSC